MVIVKMSSTYDLSKLIYYNITIIACPISNAYHSRMFGIRMETLVYSTLQLENVVRSNH